ncbi:MAG: nucleoside triphosphate pyrophosphohydrolase [Vicinamibacterales bacterium]
MADSAGDRFARLVQIMHTLRGPDGCPWDREQSLQTLRPFVLEETCELLDALDAGDMPALCEELGDVVFEAVFLAELCAEAGHFSVGDALQSVIDKLIRRHPHVFTPDGLPLPKTADITSSGVKAQWDDIKAVERSQAGKPKKPTLGGIPRALPALLRADTIGHKAAATGFDWVQPSDVLDKIEEELLELRAAVADNGPTSAEAEEELGDLLFAVANYARKLGLAPEPALTRACDKFQHRFEAMERAITADGHTIAELSAEALDERWNTAKETTKGTKNTKGTEGA